MFELSTKLVLSVTLLALVLIALTRRLSAGRLLAVAIFAVYLVGVAHFVILPLRYDPSLALIAGPVLIELMVDLRPFFVPGANAIPAYHVIDNVVMTVPFGFGLPFVVGWRLRSIIVAGVLFSVGIELTQLVADLAVVAFPPRSVDINDVTFNSLGVVLGVALFSGARSLYRRTLGRFRPPPGPLAHFHEVLVDETHAYGHRSHD